MRIFFVFVYLGLCVTFLPNEFITIFAPQYLCFSASKVEYKRVKVTVAFYCWSKVPATISLQQEKAHRTTTKNVPCVYLRFVSGYVPSMCVCLLI